MVYLTSVFDCITGSRSVKLDTTGGKISALSRRVPVEINNSSAVIRLDVTLIERVIKADAAISCYRSKGSSKERRTAL